MTDRINAFVVVLDKDIRDDDVEPIANAMDDYMARTRVNAWWQDRLLTLMRESRE